MSGRDRDSSPQRARRGDPCECGGATLTLGPVTLHFSADEVVLLHELTTRALGLDLRSPARPPSPGRQLQERRPTVPCTSVQPVLRHHPPPFTLRQRLLSEVLG